MSIINSMIVESPSKEADLHFMHELESALFGFHTYRAHLTKSEKAYGHGAEPETSAMLAMFPDDVTLDRLETGTFQSFQNWEPAGYSKVKVTGQNIPGTIYFESDDIAANGVTGDGSNGTREIGEVWIERVVGFAVAFIEQFNDKTKAADWAKAEQND